MIPALHLSCSFEERDKMRAHKVEVGRFKRHSPHNVRLDQYADPATMRAVYRADYISFNSHAWTGRFPILDIPHPVALWRWLVVGLKKLACPHRWGSREDICEVCGLSGEAHADHGWRQPWHSVEFRGHIYRGFRV